MAWHGKNCAIVACQCFSPPITVTTSNIFKYFCSYIQSLSVWSKIIPSVSPFPVVPVCESVPRMSVNTPKRPKTAYSPGQPSNEQFSVDASHLDPFYAIPDNYIPNGNPAWSWQPNTSETYPQHNGSTVNTVLSPSSSCGSPEETSAGMHRLLDIVPKTPTCTKKDRAVIPFPTPTTSTLPDGMLQMSSNSGGREHKRGRPRSESLTNLMMEGSTSPSSIKCKFCHRVFPREKSLAAHLRTHTGT